MKLDRFPIARWRLRGQGGWTFRIFAAALATASIPLLFLVSGCPVPSWPGGDAALDTDPKVATTMEEKLLPCLEQEPSQPARAAVIWMHGLGATANDFEDVPPHLGLPPDLPVRYVFPQAPSRPVTINGGWVMPAWYDIQELDGWEREETFASGRGQDEAGVRASENAIRALIARQRQRGIPAERIVVAGFSQGGAVALHTALRYEDRLAGVMVLSAGLLFADKLPKEAAPANRKTPLFLAHGSFDPVVPVMVGKRTRHFLENLGYDVEWHEYPMQHNVSLEEIQDIGRFLTRVLSAAG